MYISIEEFYQQNIVDPDFDEIFYESCYPETKEFYQPHCQINNIDNKHRLFFHYVMYAYERNKTSHIETLMKLLVDLIEINSELKSDQLLDIINNYISKTFSSMRDPVRCNIYINRRNHLVILEKLIPFLPSINIEILPENII